MSNAEWLSFIDKLVVVFWVLIAVYVMFLTRWRER